MTGRTLPGVLPLPRSAALLGGAVSVLIQSVVLREGLSGFRAAELASGMVLAGWLIMSGIAAWTAQRLDRATRRALWSVLCVAAVPACLAWLIVLRFLEPPAFVHGTLPGLIAGLLFVLPFDPSRPPGVTYALQAAGAALGGATFVFLAASASPPDMLLLAAAIAFSGLLLTGSRMIVAPLELALAVLFLTGLSGRSWTAVVAASGYPDRDSVRSVSSPYGELTITQSMGETAVYRSDLLLGSSAAPEAAEMLALIPMLLAEDPRSVLYAGTNPGVASLVTRWPGSPRLTVVTIEDEPFSFLAYGDSAAAGVTVRENDPRRYVSSSPDDHWDVVLLDLGPPLSLYDNRFYTLEFFEQLSRCLAPSGIAAFTLPAGENRVHPLQAATISSVLAAASESFPAISVVPSGGAIVLLSDNASAFASISGDTLAARLARTGVRTVHVTPGTLPYDISPLRIQALTRHIDTGAARPNRDLTPRAFLHATTSWLSRGSERSPGADLPVILIAAMLLGLLAMIRSRSPSAALAVGLLGLAEVSTEVVCLLLIQATLGYSYVLVGAVIGVFMAGMCCGALLSSRMSPARMRPVQLLAGLVLGAMALLCYLYDIGTVGSGLVVGGCCFFLASMGVAAGIQFPLAVRASGGSRRVGVLEMVDLTGSSIGAILVAAIGFPLLGATVTTLVLCVILIVSAVPLGTRPGGQGAPA